MEKKENFKIEDYKRYWDNFDPSLYALIKQVKNKKNEI